MSRPLAELLRAAPRAALLPDAVLRRAAELEAACAARAATTPVDEGLAVVRAGAAACLGLPSIERTAEPAWTPVRRIARAGYDIEVGTFEAVPGLPVAAHVYRPDGEGPFPGVVHVPGHWMENARLDPALQRTSAALARAGLLTLVYDPVGQGERRVGWHQHGQLAPLLAGFTTLGVMVAETMGALDVLAARPDVDPARLAVAGASGGGYVSAFTAALDRRVSAAAICCILNTHLGQLRDAALGTGWDGWVDLCNQVPRLAATASMGQVLAAAAPCDVTVVHAVDDPPFPIAGARAVVAEAAALAAAAAPPGRVRLVEVRGGHGLHPAMRGAAIAGLAAALGAPAPPPEADVELLDAAYAVTHEVGRAGPAAAQTHLRAAERLPGEALTASVDTNGPVVALARRRAAALRAARRPPTRADLVRTLGGEPAAHPVTARVANHLPLPGGWGQRLVLDVAPGIELDAVLLLPEGWDDDAPGVLVVLDEGGKEVALAGPAAAVAREQGWAVLAPDLRGTGESAASEFELATASWLLDRDLLAARVDDLGAMVAFLSERYSTGQQIDKRRLAVHGAGAFGLVALLGAALDDRIAAAASGPFVESLEELVIESPRVTPMAFPFGALTVWDLADLVALAVPRPALAGGRDADPAALVRELLAAVTP